MKYSQSTYATNNISPKTTLQNVNFAIFSFAFQLDTTAQEKEKFSSKTTQSFVTRYSLDGDGDGGNKKRIYCDSAVLNAVHAKREVNRE